ncbi:MAG: ROK family protein [Bacillota bacterium]
MAGYVAGVDLGGTKIYTALAGPGGEIMAEVRVPTGAGDGPDAVIGRILDTINRVSEMALPAGALLSAVGIGSPGPLDPASGVVFSSPNLPGWRCVPLRERLEQSVGAKVFVDNDANLAALGEYRFGAGRGSSHMVYVTVSTGIGGGLILDGRLYRGAGGGAGEVGHTVVDPDGPLCGCGRAGCLEALASGTAMAARARELVDSGRGAGILREAGADGEITAVSVARAAAAGDEEALGIIVRAGRYLGMGLANIINIFNPDRLVIGGGALAAGERFWESMEAELRARALGPALENVSVVRAGLDGRSGLMGAIALALAMAYTE